MCPKCIQLGIHPPAFFRGQECFQSQLCTTQTSPCLGQRQRETAESTVGIEGATNLSLGTSLYSREKSNLDGRTNGLWWIAQTFSATCVHKMTIDRHPQRKPPPFSNRDGGHRRLESSWPCVSLAPTTRQTTTNDYDKAKGSASVKGMSSPSAYTP